MPLRSAYTIDGQTLKGAYKERGTQNIRYTRIQKSRRNAIDISNKQTEKNKLIAKFELYITKQLQAKSTHDKAPSKKAREVPVTQATI